MASAKAMARIDWTRIFVEAPGLRPTASEAFMPMKPTPTAAPSAANPTCRFPVISANIGISDIYLPFFAFSAAPAIEHGQTAEILVMRGFVSLFVLTNQHREHRRQKHEDQRLNKSNQQFHEVKWNRQQPSEMRHQFRHRFQHVFTGENISVETKTERHRPEQNREHFQQTNHKKYYDHQYLQRSRRVTFGRKQMQQKSQWADLANSPYDPAQEKHQRHRQRHVQVRVRASKQWGYHFKTVLCFVTPSHHAKSRNQPGPIREQNEDEHRRKKPKCPLNQMMPDNSFQKIIQTLHHPFPEVLRSVGNVFHVARGKLRKNNEANGDDPRHHHGIGNQEGA